MRERLMMLEEDIQSNLYQRIVKEREEEAKGLKDYEHILMENIDLRSALQKSAWFERYYIFNAIIDKGAGPPEDLA